MAKQYHPGRYHNGKLLCKATNKAGNACGAFAIRGREFCNNHGGKALAGMEHPGFKNGKYSKVLTGKLAALYAAASDGIEALDHADEALVLEVRIQDLLGMLDGRGSPALWAELQRLRLVALGAFKSNNEHMVSVTVSQILDLVGIGADDQTTWERLVDVMEARRKMVDSETRRTQKQDDIWSVKEVALMMATVVQVIRKEVADELTRQRISEALNALYDPYGSAGHRPQA